MNPGVLLNCNQTVEVTAGENVTLTCYIKYRDPDGNCKGFFYEWSNSSGPIRCDTSNMEYKCEWDNETYTTLIILNVRKREKYVVRIGTDCGPAESSVSVQVKVPPSTLSE